MKIAIVTHLYPPVPRISGEDYYKSFLPTLALHDLVKLWPQQGVEVRVFIPWIYYPKVFEIFKQVRLRNKFSNFEKFSLDGVMVYRFPLKKFPRVRKISYAKKIAHEIINTMKDEKFFPEIVVSHILYPNIIIAHEISTALDIPFAHVFHYSDVIEKNKSNYIVDILKKARGIGFRSFAIKNKFEVLYGSDILKEKSIFYVLSGIDKNFIVPQDFIKFKAKKSVKSIITVSKLIKLKNVDTIIKAFAHVRKSVENIQLFIVGDGPLKKSLKKLAKRLNVSSHINFLGAQPHNKVIEFLRNSEIFAMVSSPETFGLVYLEAMASGCMTIGSKGEGIDGIIKDNVNGFLVEPRNISELANKFLYIYKMPFEKKLQVLKNALKTCYNLTLEAVSISYLTDLKNLIAK